MASTEESPPAATDEGSPVLKEAEARESPELQEELIVTVQNRLEDLLSKQNLSEDAYIQQHMNAQMYIPLSILARHHSLRAVGDEATILATAKAAAQRSDKIAVDEEAMMVKPLLKPRRNTLILHDLPDEFPEEDLNALFKSSPESEAFCSLKPDVNNTAFVTFKDDEAAQNVALWLRSQKLQEKTISVSVKSEHFVRSFYPASAGPNMQAGSPYMMPAQGWGYPGWGMPVHAGAWTPEGQYANDPNVGWGDVQQDGQGYYGKGDSKGKSPKGKGKGRKRGSLGGSFSQESMSQMESGSEMTSPYLGAAGMQTEPDIADLPEPGYTHEFRKYSRQYIIEVCNTMDEIEKPESYEKCEQNGVALFRGSPNKDWAPLPTPMATFSANFFDDRRGSDATDADGQGKGGRKASWGPKNSGRDTSYDYEESGDWSHGDSAWGKGGKGNQRSRSNTWNSGSWQGDSWQGDATYEKQQHWVKKEAKNEEEAKDDDGEPRKMSWAEKVKGSSESSEKKWVAKPKADEEAKSKEEVAGPSADLTAAAAPQRADEAAPEATKPTAAPASAEAKPASPSWADKVRLSAAKK